MNIMVLLGSARVGRQGEKVATWVARELEKRVDEGITVDLVDAAALDLPFYNEAADPFALQGNYANPKGAEWAARVAKADAFIFVTAEYNHGYTALLKNTLDWVGREWTHKPVSFVSYSSGNAGGVRAVEQLKPVVVNLRMVPLINTVFFHQIQTAFNESGEPVDPAKAKALTGVFDELITMAGKLRENP